MYLYTFLNIDIFHLWSVKFQTKLSLAGSVCFLIVSNPSCKIYPIKMGLTIFDYLQAEKTSRKILPEFTSGCQPDTIPPGFGVFVVKISAGK